LAKRIVGVYSLGYKFGFLLMFLVVTPFASIWDSEKYNIAKEENAKESFQNIFIIYSTVVILACMVISLYAKDLLRVMSAPEFWGAAKIVPVVLGGYFANALLQYVNFGILLHNKTIEITYGTLIAAAVISVGYVFLIPIYGGMGAAWATLFAFVSRTCWVYWRARRLFNMELRWKSVGILVGLWAGVSVCSLYGPSDLIASLLFNSFLLLLVIVFLIYLPILPDALRKKVHMILKNPNSVVTFIFNK